MKNKRLLLPTLKILTLVFGFSFLTSCDFFSSSNKDFQWNDEVATLTGKDLKSWLRNAPFSNELKGNDNEVMFSNAEQVFPFLGKYYNSVERQTKNYSDPETGHIYQTETILFQDPHWGDLFVNAALMYNNDELYLSDSNIETGDPMFEGKDAVFNTYHGGLMETAVHSKAQDTKNGLYWGSNSTKVYLLAFYQKNNLAFEVAVPLIGQDTLATLNKLKEVNTALGLNVPEWANAQLKDLNPLDNNGTFWKDPFQGFFAVDYFIQTVFLKILDTDFKEEQSSSDEDIHQFSANNNGGTAKFSVKTAPSTLNFEDFEKKYKDLAHYEYFHKKVYYEEKESGNEVQGKAYAFYSKDKVLEFEFSYPKNNPELKKQMHSILKYVKITNPY
ncbi:hypothetical protein [Sphingobacterium mizutaii]|uniref:hypothetical protein n=1 Tax=Sphingobacterium mizutaii TaxID=1010 RepID=UPI0028AABC3A|nr:hypothetical protein [Sphingobacterium mizutaii]